MPVTGHGTRDGHKPDYKPRCEPEYKPEAQAEAHAYAARKWRLCDRRRPAARVIYRCAFMLLYRMHGATVAAALVVIGVLERAAGAARARREHFAARSKKAE